MTFYHKKRTNNADSNTRRNGRISTITTHRSTGISGSMASSLNSSVTCCSDFIVRSNPFGQLKLWCDTLHNVSWREVTHKEEHSFSIANFWERKLFAYACFGEGRHWFQLGTSGFAEASPQRFSFHIARVFRAFQDLQELARLMLARVGGRSNSD